MEASLPLLAMALRIAVVVGALLVLGELGLAIAPLLAGAGILGLAVVIKGRVKHAFDAEAAAGRGEG